MKSTPSPPPKNANKNFIWLELAKQQMWSFLTLHRLYTFLQKNWLSTYGIKLVINTGNNSLEVICKIAETNFSLWPRFGQNFWFFCCFTFARVQNFKLRFDCVCDAKTCLIFNHEITRGQNQRFDKVRQFVVLWNYALWKPLLIDKRHFDWVWIIDLRFSVVP